MAIHFSAIEQFGEGELAKFREITGAVEDMEGHILVLIYDQLNRLLRLIIGGNDTPGVTDLPTAPAPPPEIIALWRQ